MSDSSRDEILLTAAMIVRDEEEHLGPCLESLADTTDEIVVIDTGSIDATVDIARSHGARVFDQAWTGDFSAARNAALDRARGRWILYVDADERVLPVDGDCLAETLAESEEVALRVWLRPFVGATPYREYRLWRNDPRIRFEGLIHEKVTPSISAVAAVDGRGIGDCDLTIDHLGYEGDQSAKHRRNLPLLRAQLDIEPGNVFNWHHLARVHEGLGRRADAEAALWRAVGLLRADDDPSAFGAVVYADLVRLRRSRSSATELADEGLVLYPADAKLLWVRSALDLDRDDPISALHRIEVLLALEDSDRDQAVSHDERLFGVWAHAARGLCLFRLGRFAEGAVSYRRAEELEPDSEEHRAKRMLCEQFAIREAAPGARVTN